MARVQGRIEKVQSRLRESGIDMAAIGPTANMLYLLGYVPHPDERLCLLIITDRKVRLVAPAVNLEAIAAHTDVELLSWADEEGPQAALRMARPGYEIHSMFVDGAMRADFLLQLQEAFRPERIEAVDLLMAPLRMRKSAEEIESLARAAAQADRAMKAGIDACRSGASEAEIAWSVEAAFRRDGAAAVDFALIASGPNSAYPHHHSGERVLQKGDAVILDIGATLGGFKSDITRMVHIGQPTSEFRRVYAAVLEANQRAMAAVRPGVRTSDVDRAARASLEEAGYGQYFVHRTGHGIGLEGHEPPWIIEGGETILEEGMTFSIEPGVYLSGRFGVRIEDIAAVSKSGVRNLTGFDHSPVVKD
jgi:Xaa-Pro aminopeptidase